MRNKKKIFDLMLKSRNFQIRINNLISKKGTKIPIHLAFGHELVSSIIYSQFNFKKDKLLLTHRNIHFSSLFSKNSIVQYKKFFSNKSFINNPGSMNYLDNKSPIIYTSSILGNNLSVAIGVAQTVNDQALVFCDTGDGAIEEGSFYESLHLSSYLKLPVVFVLENNNWSMATKIKDRRINFDVKLICKALKINYFNFDNNKISYSYSKLNKLLKKTRKNCKPIVLEFNVATLGGKNYHHGLAKLNTEKNFLFLKNNNDIIYRFKKQLNI